MSFLGMYLWVGLVILGYMGLLWLISLVLKNSSIVDIYWGFGFVLANWFYFALNPQRAEMRKWLISILVTIWGLRLFMYILWRNWGKEEDFRYQVWRKEAGSAWWWRSSFKVFFLEGILLWVISIPLLAVHFGSLPVAFQWLDFMGIAIWVVGFFFEFMGDLQLARFKANPVNNGKVLDSGVWRYTRRPNYFGELPNGGVTTLSQIT